MNGSYRLVYYWGLCPPSFAIAGYLLGKLTEREAWFRVKIAEKESEKISTIYKAEIISEWVSYSKKDLEKKLNEVINKEEKENTIRVKIIG